MHTYRGVAHYLACNPELDALRKHGKSFSKLADHHQKAIHDDGLGDLAVSAADRSDPKQAMQDAISLCATNDLEPTYAMIKRNDGHYFTSPEHAIMAESRGV